MVKNSPPKDIQLHMKKILPEIQRVLEGRDDASPSSKFDPLGPLLHQMEPFELVSPTTI